VADHEDHVGHQVRALAAHFSALGLAFEIIAIDAGSRDASLPVLQLLQAQIPELRLLSAASHKRALARGIGEALGAAVMLIAPATPRPVALGPVGWALARLGRGHDAVIVRDRYIVARRMAALPVALSAAKASESFERAFERLAGNLAVTIVGPARAPTPLAGVRRVLGPFLRFLAT